MISRLVDVAVDDDAVDGHRDVVADDLVADLQRLDADLDLGPVGTVRRVLVAAQQVGRWRGPGAHEGLPGAPMLSGHRTVSATTFSRNSRLATVAADEGVGARGPTSPQRSQCAAQERIAGHDGDAGGSRRLVG